MGKAHNERPSVIYGIDDELTAWCFDRAVTTFGMALENRLQEVAEDSKTRKVAQAKAQRELKKWLSSADSKAAKGMFRDPFAEMS